MRFPKPPQEIIEFQELHADERENSSQLYISYLVEKNLEKKEEIRKEHNIAAEKYNDALIAAGLNPWFGKIILKREEPRIETGVKPRMKVEVGKYKIGDEIEGHKITGFGKSWIANKALDEHFKGQLWQECDKCGTEPVYLPSELCEGCINRMFGEPIELQYAYFDGDN